VPPPSIPEAPAGSTYEVSASATLTGYSASTFGAEQQAAFVATLAAVLEASASAVNVSGVSDALQRRRSLLQAGGGGSRTAVNVAFAVASISYPTALVASLTALSVDASSFAAALRNTAGLSGVVSVSVTVPSVRVAAPEVSQNFTSVAGETVYFQDLLSNLTGLVGATDTEQTLELVNGAAASLNAATSLLNASAAAVFRAQLLNAVAAVGNTAAAPTAQLTQIASVVSLLVADPLAVTASSATTVIGILSSVSSAGAAVTGDTGNAVAGGLSNLVVAVRNANNDVNASVLTQIVGVVDSLKASLLTGVAANAAPIDITSDAIQMRVQVDAPGAGSRLFSAPLTANGSASAFAPLPSSLFAGVDTSAGVQTQFASFTFDPFDTANVSAGGGITRLAFTSAAPGGVAVEVAGLSAPIYFTLPPLTTALTAGQKPGCTFWDTAAAAYSSKGCAGIPYMRPPGHTLFWTPGYRVATDAEMAKAWNISGPLLASCAVQLLDCSKDAAGKQTDVKLSPNPANPFDFPAINCSTVDTSPKVVFVGSQCKLTQPGNAKDCYWDNMKQARCASVACLQVCVCGSAGPFVAGKVLMQPQLLRVGGAVLRRTCAQAFAGSGCIAPAGGSAECACRHLTDFASKPTIATASLSDMLSLNPADTVRLRSACASPSCTRPAVSSFSVLLT
jgi:hypothetical protein